MQGRDRGATTEFGAGTLARDASRRPVASLIDLPEARVGNDVASRTVGLEVLDELVRGVAHEAIAILIHERAAAAYEPLAHLTPRVPFAPERVDVRTLAAPA